ncbi:hypothetical protein QJQ45_015810 [Haematococcus lacustris]|nr:hypothetical protein QJQ45_015810 [Haematococcus lacustris]
MTAQHVSVNMQTSLQHAPCTMGRMQVASPFGLRSSSPGLAQATPHAARLLNRAPHALHSHRHKILCCLCPRTPTSPSAHCQLRQPAAPWINQSWWRAGGHRLRSSRPAASGLPQAGPGSTAAGGQGVGPGLDGEGQQHAVKHGPPSSLQPPLPTPHGQGSSKPVSSSHSSPGHNRHSADSATANAGSNGTSSNGSSNVSSRNGMAHSSGAVPSAPVAAAFASGSWQQAVAAGAAAAQVAALALQAVLQAAAQALVWTQQQPPLSWLLTALQPALRFCAQYHEVIRRIAVTLGLLAVIRCGLYIPLPGVDMAHLPASAAAATQGERLVKALYGQSQALPASLFELGISPLINASIAITMATSVPDELAVGWLQRLKEARKEGGRTGQATITSYMNSLSLAVAVYMGLLKALQLSPYAVLGGGSMFLPTTTLALVAGAAVVQYCSSLVTSDGLGNGTSLVICSNIVMDWADALHNMLGRMEAGDISSGTLLPLLATYLLMALAAVYISRTELRLPVVQYNRNSAAAIIKAAGTASLGAERSNPADDTDLFVRARAAADLKMAERSTRADYFPLAINASGMMVAAFQPRTQTTAMPNSVITSDCEVEEEDCEIEEVDCGDDMSIGQFNLLPPIDIATARLAAARINDGEVASKEVMAALRLFLRKRPVTVEERCSHLYECYMKMPKVLCMVLCTLATGYRKSKDGGECNADSLRQRIFSLARTVRGEHHRVKISENDMAPILPMSRHAAAAPAAYGGPPPTPGPGSWPMSGHAAEAPLAYGGPPPTPGPGSWPMSGHAAEAPAAYGGPPPTPGPGSWPGSLILAGILWFQALPAAATVCGLHALNNAILNLQASWLGLALYGLLVVGLELLPLGSLSAKEVAEYCNAINVGIKGAVPGKDTEQLISKQLLRCKLWGGVALASLAVSAHVFDMVCITVLGTPLSATSLLIVVGTVTQASRQCSNGPILQCLASASVLLDCFTANPLCSVNGATGCCMQFEGLTEGPKLNDSLKREQALIQALRMQNVPHTTSSPHPCIMARKTDKKGKGSVGKGSSGNLDDAPPAPAPTTAAASVPDVAPVAETESPVEPESRQQSSRSVLPEPVEPAEAQSQLQEALEEIAALKKQLAERDEEIALLKKTSSGSTPAPADFSHEMTKLQERLALLRKEQMEADAAKEAAWLQLKGVIADITKLAATPPSSSLPVH